MNNRLIEELREFELQLASVSEAERTPMLKSMQQILLTLKQEHVEMLGQIEQILRRINGQLDNNSRSPFINSERKSSPIVSNVTLNSVYGKEGEEKENDLLNKINKLVNQIDDSKQNVGYRPIVTSGEGQLAPPSEISTIAYLAKYNLFDENTKKPPIIERNNSERIFKTPPGKLLK